MKVMNVELLREESMCWCLLFIGRSNTKYEWWTVEGKKVRNVVALSEDGSMKDELLRESKLELLLVRVGLSSWKIRNCWGKDVLKCCCFVWECPKERYKSWTAERKYVFKCCCITCIERECPEKRYKWWTAERQEFELRIVVVLSTVPVVLMKSKKLLMERNAEIPLRKQFWARMFWQKTEMLKCWGKEKLICCL